MLDVRKSALCKRTSELLVLLQCASMGAISRWNSQGGKVVIVVSLIQGYSGKREFSTNGKSVQSKIEFIYK